MYTLIMAKTKIKKLGNDLPLNTGYTYPGGSIDTREQVGTTKKREMITYESLKTPAFKQRTVGRNIIPANAGSGMPAMVAYIDEVMPIYEECINCGLRLGKAEVLVCLGECGESDH